MFKFYVLLILILTQTYVSAQEKNGGSVKGKLRDVIHSQNLKDATITILRAEDSTIISTALTKSFGAFSISGLAVGNYILLATFEGYKRRFQTFEIQRNTVVDVGILDMEAEVVKLEEVVVKTPPMIIKGDTSEINSSQFKTQPNATLEDLLKKIWIVDVGKDGTVKAQGENVTRVLLDGKRFFGDDPQIATRNLSADMIEKVQIYNSKSDQANFSGFDDGQKEKVINLITKKDFNTGSFGRYFFGLGSLKRFNSSFSHNYFKGNKRISLIGQANNINEQNFSAQDILSVMRQGGGAMFGGFDNAQLSGGKGSGDFLSFSPGITKIIAGGINYSNNLGSKLSINASYFYNNMNVKNNQQKLRETFPVNDTTLFYSSNYLSNNKSQSHRFSLELEEKLDSTNSVLARTTFVYQRSDNTSQTSYFATKGKLIPLSSVAAFDNLKENVININTNVLFRHKFLKPGRSISLNLSDSYNDDTSTRRLLSYNSFFQNSLTATDTSNQNIDANTFGKTFGTTLSYTELIDTKKSIELKYNYIYNSNNSVRRTDDYNVVTKNFDIVDTLSTNNFNNSNVTNKFTFSYRQFFSSMFHYTVGVVLQKVQLLNENFKLNQLGQSFNNLFPTLSFEYNNSRKINLQFNYQGSTVQPSINQLEEVVNNQNPLFISKGNSALKQQFSHNFNLFFSKFNTYTLTNFVANFTAAFTSNKIGNEYIINNSTADIVVDDLVLKQGVQYAKPINLNGASNINGFINYSFPFQKGKSRINLITKYVHRRDVNLINKIEASTSNNVFLQVVKYIINVQEQIDLSFVSTSSYNMMNYNVRNNAFTYLPNSSFFSQMFTAESLFFLKKGWSVGTNFNYFFTSRKIENSNPDFILANLSITKKVLKRKEGELKLFVSDIFNQNRSSNRTIEQNYIEDVRSQVLKRYILLSFTYNFKKLYSKKDLIP